MAGVGVVQKLLKTITLILPSLNSTPPTLSQLYSTGKVDGVECCVGRSRLGVVVLNGRVAYWGVIGWGVNGDDVGRCEVAVADPAPPPEPYMKISILRFPFFFSGAFLAKGPFLIISSLRNRKLPQ